MPLSEREQALLEQMEQALYAEDPRFAAQLARSSTPRRRGRLVLGALGVVAGLAVVLLGVSTQQVWVGVVGFLVMVAAGTYALTSGSHRASLAAVAPDGSVGSRPQRSGTRRFGGLGRPSGQHPRPGASRPQRTGTFMQRLERRWDERRERGEF